MSPLLLALTLGCGSPAEPTPDAPTTAATEAGSTRDIDVDTLAAALEAGEVDVLVDVRTAGEFAAGHVPGAVNIPVSEIEARLDELAAYKEGEVHLICQSGGRSSRAAAALAAHGFDAVNVDGGTGAWTASGRATE